MNTGVSFLVLAAALSGCGFIKVNGGAAEPEALATPAAAEKTQAEPSTASTTPADAPKAKTKGDLQCESTLLGALQSKGELERNGELSLSTANKGFSADNLKANISSCYSGYGETAPAEKLAEADAMVKELLEAAIAAAPKWKMADFLVQHPDSDIKRVVMTSGWKQNMNGLVVRNRYKEAVVVIGVKDTDICMRVLANAAQDANGAGFDTKWKHDVFVRGTVVPCK
jgi:hypothetical protein